MCCLQRVFISTNLPQASLHSLALRTLEATNANTSLNVGVLPTKQLVSFINLYQNDLKFSEKGTQTPDNLWQQNYEI